MKSTWIKCGLTWSGLLLIAFTLGCQASSQGAGNANDDTTQKLAELSQRVDDMDARLKKIEDLLKQALEGPPEADPLAVYSVPVDGYPASGPANAKVTIVKAYEFACGFCFRSRDTLKQLKAQYGDNIRIVYKPFIVHPDVAVVPAMAACAADRQGKFLEMQDLIWDKGFAERDLGPDKMTALAQELGLDMERFKKDMEDGECMALIRKSVDSFQPLGVNGTPTFFINGRQLVGAQPIDAFKKLIDEELNKANQALASGAKLETYYQKAVVEAGKTSLEAGE